MDILRHPDSVVDELLAALTTNGLIYGTGETYPSLITPSSCIISQDEVAAIDADLRCLQHFYRTWNALYRAALAGEEPRWIADLCEYGLRPEEIQAQRMTLAAGLEPRFCRVDYITIGAEQKIAEVQWKSGGLGLFFGIHDVCASIAPTPTIHPGHPVQGLYQLIMRCSSHNPVAVNAVRSVWLRGEHYLRRIYTQRGIHYIVLNRREGARRIIERNGYLSIADGGKLLRIDFLYGQELLPALPPPMIVRIARAATEGKLWVETPLNYVYRQKWGMALPFMPAYAHLFDDRIRALFGAVALLRSDVVDLSPLAIGLPAEIACQLQRVRTIEQIADLSTAARRMLVLKCGAGSGLYYSQGRGVFRINGSRSAAQKTLAFVQSRIAQGEPWIIQRYVNVTYPVDVYAPWSPHPFERIDAHARLMVYATFDQSGSPQMIGGLGNFGRDWKVSGKSAQVDERGHLTGTAFNDMRFSQHL